MLLVVSPVSAGIYKWTDSNGKVHFGDRPVDVESATEININTDNHTGVTNSSGNNDEREYLLKKIDEKKQEDAEKRKKRLALKKKHQKLCDNFKRHHQNQIQSNQLYTMSPDGERTYLSDKERAVRLNKIKKGISKYCH